MTRECLAVPDTHVPVTFVSFNAHYGRAIADPNILAPDEYGDLPYVMAQEIWPNAAKKSSRIVHDREDFREKAEAAGYIVHLPDSSLDLALAVPKDNSEPKHLAEYTFNGRLLRVIKWLGRRALKRDAGVFCANFGLTGGWSVDVIQAHTIPPIPRMFTKIEERLTAAVVRDHYPALEEYERTIRLVVGDFNTYPEPGKLYEKFTSLGYTALVPLGTETCKLGKTHPLLAKAFRRRKLHLDIAMLAIPRGFELVDLDNPDINPSELKAHQIGYRTQLVETASDHLAVRTTLLLPKQKLQEDAIPKAPIRRIAEPHWPIEWPHDDRKAFRILAKVLLQGRRARLGRRDPTLSGNSALIRHINGPGSEKLADKYSFINLVANLPSGYRAPRQRLAPAGLSEEQISDITAHFADVNRLICKPTGGSGGSGIIELHPDDLAAFLKTATEDYIIQEYVPHKLEFRYVRHLAPGRKAGWNGKTYRVLFEKDIPRLYGDGQKTVLQLIREAKIPTSSKIATAAQQLHRLRQVVPAGGAIHVSNLGYHEAAVPEWGTRVRRTLPESYSQLRQVYAPLPYRSADGSRPTTAYALF